MPIHKPLVAVDQPLFMQLDEHFTDGGREAVIQGEAFSFPVA